MNRDLSSPVPWRRSQRASQARRAQRARRRRNALRGRAGVTLAVAVFSVTAAGALAQDAATPLAPGVQSTDTVRALQQKLGAGTDNSTAAPSGDAAATLQRIAQCESGGNPSAVSADGTYRGKYQFDRDTWRAMGGSGDPADAPEAEQDRIAAALLAQRGTAPWPVCG